MASMIPRTCPRSLAHMEWLLKWWTDPDDTVLDPFAGSATTLLAARNLGRRSIGIEIEERFCIVAAQRLSADVIDFSEKTSSTNKGETLIDTARNIEAMGIDVMVVRHQAAGASEGEATHPFGIVSF